VFGITTANQSKAISPAGETVMTRSKHREMSEAERAMIATDRAGEYLYQNHRDHAAEIAMRVVYRLALIWKIERDCRLIRDRDDPRLAFHITDEYVHRVHNKVAELPPPSQSDALAEHYVMTLLAEFEPDRAWLTSHNIYHTSAWFPPYKFSF
jgi:hypothetical protein